jgi:hypothetical protein
MLVRSRPSQQSPSCASLLALHRGIELRRFPADEHAVTASMPNGLRGSFQGYSSRASGELPRQLMTQLRHWLCTAAIVSAPINVPVSANTMLSP